MCLAKYIAKIALNDVFFYQLYLFVLFFTLLNIDTV